MVKNGVECHIEVYKRYMYKSRGFGDVSNVLVVSMGRLTWLAILTWVGLVVGHPLVVCPRRLEVEEVIGQATRVLDDRLSHLPPGLVP